METLVARRRYEEVPRSDTARAKAVSDGVLAIVITLLVLHLKPPPIASSGLLAQLLNQWPTYLAYVASYLYIAVVWLNHKAAFQRIKAMTRGLHWATSVCCSALRCCPGPPRSSPKPSRRATPGRPGSRRALCAHRRDAMGADRADAATLAAWPCCS